MMGRILIVEDEEKLRRAILGGLADEGFDPVAAADGESGLALALGQPFDAIILDLMLPGRGGLEVLETLRARSFSAPILILSARGDTDDRVRGLDVGADDYLAKPFAWSELMARLRACLRRSSPSAPADARIQVGDLVLDRLGQRLSRGQRSIELTRRECDVLAVLMRSAGQVVPREALALEAWNDRNVLMTNIIDVFINQIRKKLTRLDHPDAIRTVRGVGYLFAPHGPTPGGSRES
jgi:DNA-binding response OmpR family regulator